jgi:prolipoprotein diacylglyceryltransferase
MHDQDKKFKTQWEKTQLKGRWIYGLTHGSTFGFVVFILINLLRLKEESFNDIYLSQYAIKQMMTMIIAGILGYATLKWWMNQNIYKKIAFREKNPSEMH